MQEKIKFTQEQIKEKRRQKILERAAKQKKQQMQPQIIQTKQDDIKKQQHIDRHPQQLSTERHEDKFNQQQYQTDAFQRFNQMLRGQARDRLLKIFSKVLGFIVALVHIFFMYNLWNYQNKRLNKQINQNEFQFIKNKFSSENNVLFFTMLGIIYVIWFIIKTKKPSIISKTKNIQILPGSTIVQILQKLNKLLGYKIFVQFLINYVATYIVSVLVIGQILNTLQNGEWFYWNLTDIYGPIIRSQELLL